MKRVSVSIEIILTSKIILTNKVQN